MSDEERPAKMGREGSIKIHKDLDAWKMAMNLVECVYQSTSRYPKDEQYGLTLQTRRSAVSVPSNIAEGAARQSSKEFIQFLYIALGSLAELETQLLVANRLDYLKDTGVFDRLVETRRLLLGLIRYSKQKPPASQC